MRSKHLKILGSLAAILVMVMLLFLFSPMGLVRANGGLEIIATGLDNPRGIDSGPDGMLYIAEAGIGGPPESMGGTCGFNPGGEGDRCYGETGAISRVNIDGTDQQRIISDMVSLADPMAFGAGPVAATGPHDIAFDGDGDMYVTVGWGGDPVSRTAEFGPDGANFGQLALVTEVITGVFTWTNVVDIAQYEADTNPDGGPVDSNPFGMALDHPDGFAVADAGANAMFLVDPDSTAVSTLAVFPTRPISFMTGTIPMHAVPTEVVVEPDGSYIVGQLTGFPFPPDLGWVFDVPDGGGDPTTREISFTHPLDVVYDSANDYLYVLQMDDDGLFFGPELTGSVIQVLPSGARVVLESSLGLPVGMTMGSDGALYVTACMQTAPLPEPCLPQQGVVVRIEPFVPTDVSLSSLSGDAAGYTPLVLLLTLIVLIPAVTLVLRRRNAVS